MDRLFSYIHDLRPGDRLMFVCASIAFLAAVLFAIITINNRFLVEVPLRGSVFTEGFTGAPRFINPVLALTQTDKDLTALVYAGLLRVDQNGELVPYMAESITPSEDGRIYHVVLKKDSVWSDGAPVTAEDVAFTFRTVQDPVIASPQRALFEKVTIEIVGTHELNLVLPEANTSFLEALTLGIIPAHVWSSVSPDRFPYDIHNTMSVGSGAYVVDAVIPAEAGGPETYVLRPNQNVHPTAHLTVHARFYDNDTERIAALRAGEVDAVAGVDADLIGDMSGWTLNHSIVTRVLPRTFGIFFNQNKSTALRDQAVRDALAMIIDRDALVEHVLRGFGTPTHDPIPDAFAPVRTSAPEDRTGLKERVSARLEKGGWKFSSERSVWEKQLAGATTTLEFSITTLNTPVFTETVTDLQQQFANMNIPITVKTYERTDIANTVIPDRDYEALLYGTAVGRTLDMYPFWHSSRRADPGLNIAMYTNLTADESVTNMRHATTTEAKNAAYVALADILRTDVPALFLYSPQFVYLVRNDVVMNIPDKMIDQTERFALISAWHRETEAVWNIFTKTK